VSNSNFGSICDRLSAGRINLSECNAKARDRKTCTFCQPSKVGYMGPMWAGSGLCGLGEPIWHPCRTRIENASVDFPYPTHIGPTSAIVSNLTLDVFDIC
jgi:hypothetical protein